MVSCTSSTESSDYMAFENVQYIEEFPLSFTLSGEKEVDLDIIGMKDFIVFDTFLIASTVDNNGFWSCFQTKNLKFLGKLLKQGVGPNEFVYRPDVSSSQFYYQNNSLFSNLYDFQTGKLYKINITESLQTNKFKFSLINDSLPPFIFDFLAIDSNSYYCKEIANEQTQQIRCILQKGEKIIPEGWNRLNQCTLKNQEDFNILSTITQKSPLNNIIVEAPISLNQINMYSADGKFNKTICVGKKLDNLNKIQDKPKWFRKYTYGDLRTYNYFFGALYIGDTNMAFQTKRESLPIIQLFNWEGKPLAELRLNRFITSFDIDLHDGILFTIDNQTDEFYRYDIQDILSKLHPN